MQNHRREATGTGIANAAAISVDFYFAILHVTILTYYPDMRIKIIQVGKTRHKYIDSGVDEFLKRLKPFAHVEIIDIKPEKSLDDEAIKILKAVKEGQIVLLDEKGKGFSSQEFARFLEKYKDNGETVNFIIGGAYGISPILKEKADHLISLSKMTFTHQMIRLFLVEQIYRGVCIFLGR